MPHVREREPNPDELPLDAAKNGTDEPAASADDGSASARTTRRTPRHSTRSRAANPCVHGDGELDHEAVGHRARIVPSWCAPPSSAKTMSRLEADPAMSETLSRSRTSRRPRRRCPPGARSATWRSGWRARRLLEARVDLEVDVRPAARVAGREDARELDDPVIARRLDAAQVVLVLDALRVQRVAPGLVAVPGVDRGARERRARLGEVEDREPDRERDAGRDGRARAEARRMSLRTTPLSFEDVRTVGAVAREGAGGLLGDLGAQRGGRRGGARCGRCRCGRARGRAGTRRTGRDPEADPGQPDALEHAPTVDQGLATSKARPWSQAGSVGSGRGRPSKVGWAGSSAGRRIVSVVIASPVGTRRVSPGDAHSLPTGSTSR